MKNILRALIACLCLTAPLFGQVIVINGSHVMDSAGTLVSNATITFRPALPNGQSASYRVGSSGGQAIVRPISANIVAGVFSTNIIDTSLTVPVNLCYSTTITDNVTGNSLLGPGYGCVQPASSNSWCSGGTCNFDAYPPNLTAQIGPEFPVPGTANQVIVSSGSQTALASTVMISGGNLNVPGVINGPKEILAGYDTASPIIATLTVPANPVTLRLQGRYGLITDFDGTHGNLTAVDVGNPSSPAVIGSTITDSVGLQGNGVVILGNYAYVTFGDTCKLGIYTMVNSASAIPVLITSLPLGCVAGERSFQIAAQGNEIYISLAATGGVTGHLVAVSALTRTIDGSVAMPSGNSSNSVIVEYPIAYVITGGSSTGTISAYNVSNPASMTLLSSVTVDHSSQSIYKQDRYIYVSQFDTNVVDVVDAKNPGSLSLVGTPALPAGCGGNPVQAQGKRLYVGCYNLGTIAIFDLNNPAAPSLLGSTTTNSGTEQDLVIQGTTAYSIGSASLIVSDLGGLYVQTLSAGSLETAAAAVRGSLTAMNGYFKSGVHVGGDLGVDGVLSATKNITTNGTVTAGTGFNGRSLALTMAGSGSAAPHMLESEMLTGSVAGDNPFLQVGSDFLSLDSTQVGFVYAGSSSFGNKATFGVFGGPLLTVDGNGSMVVPAQLTLTSTTGLGCNASTKGSIVYVNTGSGVKDTVQVCAKDAANTYAFRTIY